MISVDGWFDWAKRMPGPPAKVWPDKNALQGVVFHSAVGSLQGVINVVMGPITNERSVTGVVAYDGSLTQFYPVTASPWANGGHTPNRLFNGFENEGGFPNAAEINTPKVWKLEKTLKAVNEPLKDAQRESGVRILQDLAVFKGVEISYWRRPTSLGDLAASLYEHNEMTRFGALPTACPSGRIPWQVIIKELSMKNGWVPEGNFWVLYNGPDKPVVRYGSTDGLHQGRFSKLFGDNYLWQRTLDDNDPPNLVPEYWSDVEGD